MDALLEAALKIESYKFKCQFCNRGFSLKSNCVRHERIHTNEKPHTCKICLTRFILKKNMVDHMRVHTGEKPFGCDRCSRKFNRHSSFIRHYRIHTGEKPYTCHHCHKGFAWKTYLKRHFLMSHVNVGKKIVAQQEKPNLAQLKAGLSVDGTNRRIIVRIPRNEYAKEIKREETSKMEPIRNSQFGSMLKKRLVVRVTRWTFEEKKDF